MKSSVTSILRRHLVGKLCPPVFSFNLSTISDFRYNINKGGGIIVMWGSSQSLDLNPIRNVAQLENRCSKMFFPIYLTVWSRLQITGKHFHLYIMCTKVGIEIPQNIDSVPCECKLHTGSLFFLTNRVLLKITAKQH